MPTPYRAAYRENLHDNSDIEALEREREEALNPKPKTEEVEGAPDPDNLPPPVNLEEETFKKRYADLRRHLAGKEKELSNKIAALEAKLNAATTSALELPKSDDASEVQEWIKQYPDVARIVTKIAETQAEKQTLEVKKQLELVERDRQLNARQAAELKLREHHPDIDSLKNSESFHAWVADQPSYIQDALYNNATDWKAATKAIDYYKLSIAPVDAPKRGRPRKEDIEASAPVTVKNRVEPEASGNRRVWKESEIQKMNHRDFEKYEDEIVAARNEGRLVFDLKNKMASM